MNSEKDSEISKTPPKNSSGKKSTSKIILNEKSPPRNIKNAKIEEVASTPPSENINKKINEHKKNDEKQNFKNICINLEKSLNTIPSSITGLFQNKNNDNFGHHDLVSSSSSSNSSSSQTLSNKSINIYTESQKNLIDDLGTKFSLENENDCNFFMTKKKKLSQSQSSGTSTNSYIILHSQKTKIKFVLYKDPFDKWDKFTKESKIDDDAESGDSVIERGILAAYEQIKLANEYLKTENENKTKECRN